MAISAATVPLSEQADLRARIDGAVLGPDDPAFDPARLSWNRAYTHRPAMVVLPTSASDVVEAIRFARSAGLSVAVQSTGHGPTREANGALLLNLSRMDDVRVDAAAQRARIAGGATWQPVLEAATPRGLAPLVGSSPGVGAVGYTLGGGVGWLARRYGLSADSVTRFEVVTADGRLRTASASQEEELFWALRGAGMGNLGIVTGMEVRLHPVAEVYGGNLLYPAEMAAEVLERWRDWLPVVPDELTSAVVLMNYPPLEAVPEPLRGRSFAIVRGAYTGPVAEAVELLSYWRDWHEPVIDAFTSLPFSRIAEVSQDPVEPMPAMGRGLWLRELPRPTIETLVGATLPTDELPLLALAEIRHVGGAVSRIDASSTAYGNRDAALLLNLVGTVPTPETAAAVDACIEAVEAGVASAATGGRYLNFLDGPKRRHHFLDGLTDDAAERLRRLLADLDPHGLFDHGLELPAG